MGGRGGGGSDRESEIRWGEGQRYSGVGGRIGSQKYGGVGVRDTVGWGWGGGSDRESEIQWVGMGSELWWRKRGVGDRGGGGWGRIGSQKYDGVGVGSEIR